MNTTSVLAVIPARSGSKGVHEKNIRAIGRHPLLSYSVALANLVPSIGRTIVSTDSDAYAVIARHYGAEVPFLRPADISRDTSTDSEFFRHAYEWFEQNEGYKPDLVVHLRPTTPFRRVDIVASAVTFMLENPDVTSLRSGYETHLTPYKMFKSEDGFLKPFLEIRGVDEFYNLPRQSFEKAYIPNGYVDILRPDTLLAKNQLHGAKMKLWETPIVPDIDTEEELADANRYLKYSEFEKIIAYLDERKIFFGTSSSQNTMR